MDKTNNVLPNNIHPSIQNATIDIMIERFQFLGITCCGLSEFLPKFSSTVAVYILRDAVRCALFKDSTTLVNLSGNNYMKA